MKIKTKVRPCRLTPMLARSPTATQFFMISIMVVAGRMLLLNRLRPLYILFQRWPVGFCE
jgi:hypothetical protein